MGVIPVNSTVTVTTAATRVRGTATSTYVTSVYVEALSTNSGSIFVGVADVTSTKYIAKLTAGQGFTIGVDAQGSVGSSTGGGEIQLNSIYFDTSSSGDKVQMTYLQRVGIA